MYLSINDVGSPYGSVCIYPVVTDQFAVHLALVGAFTASGIGRHFPILSDVEVGRGQHGIRINCAASS